LTEPTGQSPTHRELAERAYAAIATRDLEGLIECVDPSVEFTSLVAEADGRTYRGHAGVREWWDEMATSLGGLDFRFEDFRQVGSGGVVRVRAVGTIADIEVVQTMWQAAEVASGRLVWWGSFRTEEEAVAAAEARTS
jgi:ketosteroid isomerase-like protein